MIAEEKRELYDKAWDVHTEVLNAQNLAQTQRAMLNVMDLIIEIIEEMETEDDNK